MEPRERLLRALRHEPTDRAPKHIRLTPPLYQVFRQRTGAASVEDYFEWEMRQVEIAPTTRRPDFTPYLPNDLPPGTEVDEWGVAWVPGSMYHFTRMIHPLASVNTVRALRDYPWPDVTADYRRRDLSRQMADLHRRGYSSFAYVPCIFGTIWESAWRLRGMEAMFVDMIEHPDYARELLSTLTDLACDNAAFLARAGADVIRLADDVGTQRGLMMSARMWREWLKPGLAAVVAAARRESPDIHIFYHSDGDVTELVPEFIEIGIDILNPVQPECMDPIALKKQYGDRLCFWGTIGTQTTMPFGTPDEVRATVRHMIDTVGRGGGLVVGPTHMLEPDVPWEDVEALADAIRTTPVPP